jgi:hypothetical protein
MEPFSTSNGAHPASSASSPIEATNDNLVTKVLVAGALVCATAVVGTIFRKRSSKVAEEEREKDRRSRQKVENALEELTEKERLRRRQLEEEVKKLKEEADKKQQDIQRLKELKEKEEQEARLRQAEVIQKRACFHAQWWCCNLQPFRLAFRPFKNDFLVVLSPRSVLLALLSFCACRLFHVQSLAVMA